MGCVWRSYPRFEFLQQTGLLKLDENSYDKVKLSIKNPDYKEISLNKFVYAYLYDLSTHGLKIDFDRYLLLHLLGYKTLVEPFVSAKHHVDLDKLDTPLKVMLVQDEMLKVANARFRAFLEDFHDDLAKLTTKQRLEVVANLVRQVAILQGGRWDIVDKWVSVEKSLGLHALKSLAGSLYFWNYFMITITLREHYQTLLEKEEVLIQAGQGGYVKWDDWQLIKKWYDRAGSLTDVEYHLKNSQEALEKFIFELDWIPFIAGELGSEFLAYRIAQGVTSFLWNTAKVLSLLHPAGRLARGAFLLAKWFSQSIVAFATWLGLEWLLDGLIQKVIRTPVEGLKDLFDLPNREFFGLTKEEFFYVVNYFAKKEALNLNITDPYASELFARMSPKGQALILSIVHRERIKSIAREAKKRIRQTIKDILPKIPNLPDVRTKCFDVKLPSPEEMYNLFNTLTELYDAHAKLSIIGLTGNDEENITTQVRDENLSNAIRKVFEYSQPPPRSVREKHPDYPPASGRLEATLNIYTRLTPDGFPVNGYSFSFYNRSIAICYFEQPKPPPFEPHLKPPPITRAIITSNFNSFEYEFNQDCNRFYYSVATKSINTYTNECSDTGYATNRYSSFSIHVKRRPYTSNEYESGNKSIVKLIRLLFALKPSFALRLDENLYRLYIRPLTVGESLAASKLIMLPSKFMYYSYLKHVDYELYMYQGHTHIDTGGGTVKETFKLSKMHLNTYSYYLFSPSPDMIYIFYYYYVYYLPPTELQRQIIITHPDGGTQVTGNLDYWQHMKYEYKSNSLQIPVVQKTEITPVSLTSASEDAPEYPSDDFNIPDDIPPCVNKVQISD